MQLNYFRVGKITDLRTLEQGDGFVTHVQCADCIDSNYVFDLIGAGQAVLIDGPQDDAQCELCGTRRVQREIWLKAEDR